MNGYALSYSSGLAAFNALLVYLNPKVVAIGQAYHGCHGVIDLHARKRTLKKVEAADESSWDAAGLGKGDLVHLETPINPTGEVLDIAVFAEKAHKRGAYLSVDATLGPPGLQDPFLHGADFIMHSGTKYIGGHSDMLCGILVVQQKEWYKSLWEERLYLGSALGTLEGWLGVRSLRTLELRVQRQSQNAEKLVAWLDHSLKSKSPENDDKGIASVLERVQHGSLQTDDLTWIKKQMPNGFSPVFALWMKSEDFARRLPSKLKLFHHATSLGGIESLIEWRKMSDPYVDPRLLRISVGAENWEDLKNDLLEGFRALI
jgi:cystathionine gamma-synthase